MPDTTRTMEDVSRPTYYDPETGKPTEAARSLGRGDVYVKIRSAPMAVLPISKMVAERHIGPDDEWTYQTITAPAELARLEKRGDDMQRERDEARRLLARRDVENDRHIDEAATERAARERAESETSSLRARIVDLERERADACRDAASAKAQCLRLSGDLANLRRATIAIQNTENTRLMDELKQARRTLWLVVKHTGGKVAIPTTAIVAAPKDDAMMMVAVTERAGLVLHAHIAESAACTYTTRAPIDLGDGMVIAKGATITCRACGARPGERCGDGVIDKTPAAPGSIHGAPDKEAPHA